MKCMIIQWHSLSEDLVVIDCPICLFLLFNFFFQLFPMCTSIKKSRFNSTSKIVFTSSYTYAIIHPLKAVKSIARFH